MSIFSKTYSGVLILLLFVNIFVLELFEFNILGITFLLFCLFLCILRLKGGPKNEQPQNNFQTVINKIRKNVGWKKILLTTAISIVIALAAFILTIVIALGGTPIDIWLINLSFIGLFGVAVFAYRVLRTNTSIIKTFLVLFISVFTFEHLHVSKALWPNENEKVFGLSQRKYNKIHSGGWDWGEDWYRVNVTKEELPQVLNHFNRYRHGKEPYLTRDTIKVIPFNSIIGLNAVEPHDEIEVPCLHWYHRTSYDYFPQIPLHIFYEENSETLLVTEVTEF